MHLLDIADSFDCISYILIHDIDVKDEKKTIWKLIRRVKQEELTKESMADVDFSWLHWTNGWAWYLYQNGPRPAPLLQTRLPPAPDGDRGAGL